MASLLQLISPLVALEGEWADFRAIAVVIIAVVFLIGSIYMLLASNLGAHLAYLVTMLSLSSFMIIFSVMWLVGAPGTTTATGPRGPEPQWIPFTAESEQGRDLRDVLATYPSGWDSAVVTTPEGEIEGRKYPGNIDARGELEGVRTAVTGALARAAERDAEALPPAEQGKALKKPDNWMFTPSDIEPATPDDRLLPKATVRYTFRGTRLYFGATIPSVTEQDCLLASGKPRPGCKPHPEVTVFAMRDKGKVYLQALVFLIVSLLVFVSHLVLIGRYELRKKAEEAALALEPANA